MPSYMNTKAPNAWNDPPIVTPKVKPPPSSLNKPEMPVFFQPTMPVTSIPAPGGNMGGVYQPQQHPYPMQTQPNQPYGQAVMGGYDAPSSFTNQYQAPIASSNQVFQPTFNQTFQPNQNYQAKASVSPQTSGQIEKLAAVEKAPIPAEHQAIKSVFDTLLNKCIDSTSAPVVKRKLEDVSKKLDVLYDKLRDSTVNFDLFDLNLI